MAKFKPIGIPTTNGITLGVDIETTTLAISTTGPSGYIPISGFNANIPKKVSELENDAGYITINDIPSTDLSNYYNKTESDEKFALKDDVNSKLALSIVEDFPTSGINNTLYVNNENHTQIYANDQWKDIAVEVVENLDNPNQITIPTTEAVSSFVDTKISEIDIPSTDLSNYYNKTESDNKFATKDQIVKEVIYVDTFPSAGIKDTIYVTNDGETKIWNGSDFINMSYEAIDTISENENNNTTIPTVKAVIDYVSGITPTLPDNITTQGNEFNTGNQLVQLVNGKIPDTLYDKDIQHIFYVTEFPTSGVANSLYVKQDTKETKIYTGSEYVSISLEVINDLTTATSETIATSKSIVDYLSAYYADKAYVTEAVTNAMLSGEVDLTPYAKTEWVNTELAKKANLTDIKDHIIKVDSLPDVSAALANSIYILNDSSATFFDGTEFIPLSLETVTDFSTVNQITIPTTEAVSSFVDTKISEIDIPSTDLSNYYNKTESDEKFALKDDVNSKLTLSVVEDFPSSGINNTLYVNNENHTQIYANDQWKDIAIEVVENLDNPNQITVPTTEAVSSFVDEKISNIDIPSTNLNNYYTKTEADDKFITLANIPEEVIYTSEFPASGINNTIYVNDEGQSKIYANDNWINMSLKVDTEITADAVSSVPTTKAVYDFVSSVSGSSVDLTNYNGNVSLHTTNSEQGWMASYFVADGQKIQMEYTNAENNSFAIASSNFIGIGVYKMDGKESIEITNNNILISTSNLTYNGFNTNTGNGLVELVDGKIPSGLYDTTNIPYNTLLVESVSDFPGSGTNNTMYIADSSEARVYTDGEWKNISIEVVENIDTPNQTTVPTTQAVKDYVDANAGSGGISSITVGEGLTGNGTSGSPLKLDLTHFNTAYGITIVADETLKLISNHSIIIGDNNVGVAINAPVLTFNGHDLNTAGGLACIDEGTGKLPSSIIPDTGSAAPTYTKVTINQSDFSNDDATYTLNGETGGKYYELDGICDVTVTNADGYVIGLDVRYMFDTSKTRLYIPNSLAAGTITNWTIVYLVKTIA